jgi:hypothetical protein
MTSKQDISVWVSQVLSGFKEREDLADSDLPTVTKFLVDNYELLHYYDFDYAYDDILKFLKEKDA